MNGVFPNPCFRARQATRRGRTAPVAGVLLFRSGMST